MDDAPVAHQADLRGADDLAGQDVAAGDGADAGGPEDLTDLGGAQLFLDVLGLEQAHQGRLDVLDGLVDDPVRAYVDALLLGQGFGGHRRTHVEADDHGLGGRRQHDVGLVDAADARVDRPRP